MLERKTVMVTGGICKGDILERDFNNAITGNKSWILKNLYHIIAQSIQDNKVLRITKPLGFGQDMVYTYKLSKDGTSTKEQHNMSFKDTLIGHYEYKDFYLFFRSIDKLLYATDKSKLKIELI